MKVDCVGKISEKLLSWWKGSYSADKWLLPLLLFLLVKTQWSHKPAKNNGVGLGRTLNHWEHLKWLAAPALVCSPYNSCYVRKRKPLFSYATMCELLLHILFYWFILFYFILCHTLDMVFSLHYCHLWRWSIWENEINSHIYTHKSQETNRSRSSCFLCPEFLCSWGLYHMSQWNLVLLKFLKVWFLSLANKRTPGDMKIKTNILSMQQISQTCDSLPELLICWDRKEEFGFLTWCYLFRGFGMSPKVFQSQFPHLQ